MKKNITLSTSKKDLKKRKKMIKIVRAENKATLIGFCLGLTLATVLGIIALGIVSVI
jgi:hypothetical protein